MPGQRPAVQCDAVPGDALHVRHPGIVIEGRVVVLVLLDDGEDASGRLASRSAGRHRRAQDPALRVVESDLLGLDRHDRHDRLACLARRGLAGWRGSHLRLAGWRGSRLSRRGVGGQRGQCGHRRERHNGGNAPTPRRHGGLRRHEAIYHAMSRACRRLPRSDRRPAYLSHQTRHWVGFMSTQPSCCALTGGGLSCAPATPISSGPYFRWGWPPARLHKIPLNPGMS